MILTLSKTLMIGVMPNTHLKTQQNHVLYLISSEEGITHESFATTIITKSQIQRMPGAEKAKNNEIKNLKVLMHLRLLPMMVSMPSRPDGW